MAEEVKTEEVTSPQAEVKDFDFDRFLAQLGKESPDMSIIKDGVEKFGTGKLPDALKERFLKELFPEGNKHLSLGFENLQGITNTMAALEDLSRNGKLNSDQVKGVLLAESPHDGKNMVSTLAFNARAGDFKLQHIKDPEAVQAIEKNMDVNKLALGFLAELDKDMVKDVINTPDKSDKNFSLDGLEKSGKSETLSEFKRNLAAIEIDGKENETEVSGNEGVLVDGKPNEGLTVNAPKKEDVEDEKTAKMDPQAGKDRVRREPFKFEKMKEQDIIQYMFENWLLEIMTQVIKAPFWVADKMLDALDSKYDTNIPISTAKDRLPKNVEAIKFLNDAGANAANNCNKSLQNQADYYTALFNTLKKNYRNTDFADWKIEKVSGKPVFDVKNEADLNKMKEFNDMLSDMSKEDVEIKFGGAGKQIEAHLKGFKNNARAAGIIAATLYLANNIDGPFDTNAENRVRNNMVAYMTKFYDISQHIAQRVEKEYRTKNGLDLEGPLSPEHAAKIYEQSGKLFNDYIGDIVKDTKDIRDNLNNYYNAGNKETQEVTKRSINTAKTSLEKMFSEEYLNEFLDAKAPNTKGEKFAEDKKEISILDFTRTELDADARDKAVNAVLTGKRHLHESMAAENLERKKNFKEGVRKIQGKGRKVVRRAADIFRKSGKEK